MGLPRIWSIVYTNSSRRWLEEMHRRLGSCPLLFRRGVGLRSGTNRTHRTKTIDLWANDKATQFVVGASLPILESLTILGYNHVYKFTGSAPRLRMLSVTNCALSLTRPCFPALQVDTPPPVLPLSLLERLPSMRELELCGAMGISEVS